MSTTETKPEPIRITIPQRVYLLPGTALALGAVLGFVRGSRTASLRFLAENVHRPPTTVQGWYFYNKTKNYKVLLGGLKAGGADALKLGATAAGWVAIEDSCTRMGWNDISEVAAGFGTATLFSAIYRLPWKTTSRTVFLGFTMGVLLRGLRWSQDYIREQAQEKQLHEAVDTRNHETDSPQPSS
ncbi:hypothetical protein ABKN59_000562 [Abortiporus biennis]